MGWHALVEQTEGGGGDVWGLSERRKQETGAWLWERGKGNYFVICDLAIFKYVSPFNINCDVH